MGDFMGMGGIFVLSTLVLGMIFVALIVAGIFLYFGCKLGSVQCERWWINTHIGLGRHQPHLPLGSLGACRRSLPLSRGPQLLPLV